MSNGSSTPQELSCRDVCLRWGDDAGLTIQDVSLTLSKGQFVAIVGPSGCGKTTLLSILSGLRRPTSGTVFLDGEVQPGLVPGVGMIFQEHGLYPWLRVAENVEFGLQFNGTPSAQRKDTVARVLDRVGLAQSARKYPHQLSGGMKQRVALARSLAQNLPFILMDEPFAALDFQTRYLMQGFLLELWEEYRPGIAFVTHYIDEAVVLADRVLLMSVAPGAIVEEVSVPLLRPRDPTSPEFNEYRAHITRHLEAEVMKVFQSAKGGTRVQRG